jgi:hypothetical protein
MIGMSKLLHTNDSPLQLLNLDKIAQSVSFIQRKTQGFSAFGFIIALIKCCAKGEGSFYHISLELGYLEQKIISRVAVYKRITTKATLFLRTTINELIHQSARSIYEVSTKHGFLRVLIEDSTFQRMCFGNAANVPAHGNGKSRTAGFKIDLAYDLLTGLPISQIFTCGTHQDKELGKALLGLVKAGDLVLRDMGYFVIESFQIIASKGAFWLTRLPANVSVTFLDGTAIEKRLRSRANTFIDEEVYVGKCGMKARLLAVRADDDIAAKRRRDRNAKSKGQQASSQSLVRDGWHILLTNVGTDVTAKELFDIYSVRWNIETRFKAWKQSLNLKNVFNRVSNEAHHECLILAALIQQLIGFNLATQLRKFKTISLSIEKLFEVLTTHLNSLNRNSMHHPIRFSISQISLDRRVRQSSHNQYLNLLS